MRLRKLLPALALLAILGGRAHAQTAYQTIDNDPNKPNFSVTPGWVLYDGTSFGIQGFNQKLHYVAGNGAGAEVATFTFSGLTPGTYLVSATWFEHPNRSKNAPFHISGHSVNGPVKVEVNQENFPGDFHDAGANWKVLSNYTIDGTTLTVQVKDNPAVLNPPEDDSNRYVIADAIRIQRVGFQGRTIDNRLYSGTTTPTDPGFTFVGNWTNYDNQTFGLQGLQNNLLYIHSPTATAGSKAIYTFNGLQPGLYKISTTWKEDPNRASDAVYTINGGANIVINQESLPGPLDDASVNWTDLADSFNLVAGTTITVELLGTGADEYVIADAVRLERIDGVSPPTKADVVRLLNQGSWGPTDGVCNEVIAKGIPSYVDEQVNFYSVIPYPTLPLMSNANNNGPGCPAPVAGAPDQATRSRCLRDNYTMYPLQNIFFFRSLYMPDQVRQRTSFALHQLVMVAGTEQGWQPSWQSPYLQLCDNYAFGNYREFLKAISLNPAMGNYLDNVNSNKNLPNENFAREVLQLFSIGLFELNVDGTLKMDGGGNLIPTYDQSTIVDFSKILTGWVFAPINPGRGDPPGSVNYIDPMIPGAAANHDVTAVTLLQGEVVQATTYGPQQPKFTGQTRTTAKDLEVVIDNIMKHPNVGPYVCKHLISNLVTNNPSPAYMTDVVAVFNANLTSPNQLREVVRAILLHDEARGDFKSDPNYGRIRHPAQYVLGFMRPYDPRGANGSVAGSVNNRDKPSDGVLNWTMLRAVGGMNNSMNMDIFRAPSVFSYYDADQKIDGTVAAPEISIIDNRVSLARANYISNVLLPNTNSALTTRNVIAATAPATGDIGQPFAQGNIGLNTYNPAAAPYMPVGTSIDLVKLFNLAHDVTALVAHVNEFHMAGAMSAEMQTSIIDTTNTIIVGNPITAAQRMRRVNYVLYLTITSAQYQVQR